MVINGKPKVAFLATRDIKEGEEILWDYGPELQRCPPDWMKKKKKDALPESDISSEVDDNVNSSAIVHCGCHH